MSPHHLTHLEPIVTFPTKKGRRVFLFVGSIIFVLVLLFLSCCGILLLATSDEPEFMMWVLLAGALFGMVFFGAIAFGVAKNQLGRSEERRVGKEGRSREWRGAGSGGRGTRQTK